MVRRPKFVQHIPEEAAPALFEIIERAPGVSYWHARIADAIVGDEPEFRYATPRKGCQFSIQQLANAVASELNEARGRFSLQEVTDGIPTFTAWFVSDSRNVICVRSTDHARQSPIDVAAATAAWRRFKQQKEC